MLEIIRGPLSPMAVDVTPHDVCIAWRHEHVPRKPSWRRKGKGTRGNFFIFFLRCPLCSREFSSPPLKFSMIPGGRGIDVKFADANVGQMQTSTCDTRIPAKANVWLSKYLGIYLQTRACNAERVSFLFPDLLYFWRIFGVEERWGWRCETKGESWNIEYSVDTKILFYNNFLK